MRRVRGWLAGQDHPRAVLTDHEVELVRQMRADGWTYAALASAFEVSKSTIADLCQHRRRAGPTGRSFRGEPVRCA